MDERKEGGEMRSGGLRGPLRRVTGLFVRTRNVSLTRQLFRLGDQGRAISLSLQHLSPVEGLGGLKRGTLKEALLELMEEKAFLGHLNASLLDASEELSKRKIRGTVGMFDYGPLLYALVRVAKPSVMVETGVASGTSSAYVLKAMEKNRRGQLCSIDLPEGDTRDPKYTTFQFQRKGRFGPTLIPPNLRTGYAVPEEFKKRWRLILGDSKVELPKLLKELGALDIFFHDSMHSYDHMMFEFQTAYPFIRPEGGLLLSDDVSWNRSFKDFSQQVKRPYCLRPIGVLIK